MKIEQLIYFTETAKHEHIGKAAKILGISPSAISHSIRALEGELGVELFQKKGKYIALTDQGRKLQDRSQELVVGFQNLRHELIDETNDQSFFKLAGTHLLASNILMPAWAKLTKKYQNTTVEILSLRSAQVVEAVLDKSIDFGICFSPQSHPDLEKEIIHKGQMYFVVRKGHPVLKFTGEKSIKELKNYPSSLPKAFQGIEVCAFNPMISKYGLDSTPKTLIDSYDTNMELIRHSNHWGFIPESIINMYPKNQFVILKTKSGWKAPYDISIIWRKRRYIPKFFEDMKCQVLIR